MKSGFSDHCEKPAAHVLDLLLARELFPDCARELVRWDDPGEVGLFTAGHGAAAAEFGFVVELGEFVAFLKGGERGFELVFVDGGR